MDAGQVTVAIVASLAGASALWASAHKIVVAVLDYRNGVRQRETASKEQDEAELKAEIQALRIDLINERRYVEMLLIAFARAGGEPPSRPGG